VLDGPGQAVLATHGGEPLQRPEVELDLRHAATGQRDAAVGGTCLDAHLGESHGRLTGLLMQLAAEPVQVCPQLLFRRVLLALLADLATDTDRDAIRLLVPDERRDLRCASIVLALLLVHHRKGEIDQGG